MSTKCILKDEDLLNVNGGTLEIQAGIYVMVNYSGVSKQGASGGGFYNGTYASEEAAAEAGRVFCLDFYEKGYSSCSYKVMLVDASLNVTYREEVIVPKPVNAIYGLKK